MLQLPAQPASPMELAKAELRRLLTKTPKGHSNWSYQSAVQFKKDLAQARRTLDSGRASAGELLAQANKLEAWHR